MLKILGIMLLLSSTAPSLAQTEEETAGWILRQTEINPRELKHRIDGDVLVSQTNMVRGIGGLGGGLIEKGIPISRIKYITYVQTDKYLSYSMTCDEPCAYLLDEPDTKRPKFLFEIYAKFDASFPVRMNKALLHLIKLHGGQVKSIQKQASPREAF